MPLQLLPDGDRTGGKINAVPTQAHDFPFPHTGKQRHQKQPPQGFPFQSGDKSPCFLFIERAQLPALVFGKGAGIGGVRLDIPDRNCLLQRLVDDAVDIIREMDEDKQEEVLSHIEDIEQAGDIVDLLKYDEDTAGGLMGTEMVIVNENWSMPECLKEMRIQAEDMDEIYYVYVVDDDQRLRGVFPLKKMITSPSVSKVKHVMRKEPISVHVDTPIDEVVQTIEKYDLVAVPVVDSIGRLVGRITVDDVMDEVREQAERDYQLASGLSQDVETDDNVFRQTTAVCPGCSSA